MASNAMLKDCETNNVSCSKPCNCEKYKFLSPEYFCSCKQIVKQDQNINIATAPDSVSCAAVDSDAAKIDNNNSDMSSEFFTQCNYYHFTSINHELQKLKMLMTYYYFMQMSEACKKC